MTWGGPGRGNLDINLLATFAAPTGIDELTPVGYLVMIQNGPRVYISGDTSYHPLLAQVAAPHRPDIAILVINGQYNNLSPAEAARVAREMDAKMIIPSHYDLFPDNQEDPHKLWTNLRLMHLDDRMRVLEHGKAFIYPQRK